MAHIKNAAAFRFLAVSPDHQGQGLGRFLTELCIQKTKDLGFSRLIIHSTKAMQVARGMYERLGFKRYPEIDFSLGNFQIYGFKLDLLD